MKVNNRIHLCLAKMSPDGAEQRYIQEAFDTNWVAPLGPNVNAFEKDLEGYLGEDRHVTALSSCTAAIHLALLLLGVENGDEVICQSMSFCASSNPVAYCGAKPIFVDSDEATWNMSSELLETAIKDRIAKTGRKPKAIIVMDLYGMPAQWDEIEAIANRYEIPVVEDAANALGSSYKGRPCGTFGDIATLSFNGNKIITTSGGGALITPNEDAWREIMMYATQYRESYPYYQHEKIGFNYRMSNICAGIGRGQMTIVDEHIAHHKHVQKLYEELLADVKGVTVHKQPEASPQPSPEGKGALKSHPSGGDLEGAYDSNYWLCTITLDPDLKIKGQENAYKTVVQGAVGGAAGVIHVADSATTDCQPNDNVEALRVFMDAAGIEARPVWKPMHRQPVYRRTIDNGELKMEKLPCGAICQTSETSVAYINGISEAIFKVGMCLPAGPYVTDDDVKYIVETIKAAMG